MTVSQPNYAQKVNGLNSNALWQNESCFLSKQPNFIYVVGCKSQPKIVGSYLGTHQIDSQSNKQTTMIFLDSMFKMSLIIKVDLDAPNLGLMI